MRGGIIETDNPRVLVKILLFEFDSEFVSLKNCENC